MTRPRRPQSEPEAPRPLALQEPKAEVRARLDDLIERGNELAAQDFSAFQVDADLEEWRSRRRRWLDFVKEVLVRAYTTSAPHDEFARSTTSVAFSTGGPRNLAREFAWDKRYLAGGINVLQSLVERLELVPDPAAVTPSRPEVSLASRDVFVVHGRDDGLRDTVARALQQLGFKPIILVEQPNHGRTLIEKFEANALDVGFAVVILSPDDYARGPDDVDFPSAPNRARQNVILELGYFMGSLGRQRVCALYAPGTETPSDIHGLAYIPIDPAGAWKFKLGNELHAAGYEVDLNRLR